MEETGALLFAAFGLAAIAGLCDALRRSTARGTLQRNSVIGLKTKVTLASDAAWSSGHRAAGPWLRACAWTGYAMAGATAAAVAAGSSDSFHPALLFFPGAGFLAVIVLLILATVVANRHGRDSATTAP